MHYDDDDGGNSSCGTCEIGADRVMNGRQRAAVEKISREMMEATVVLARQGW